ARDAGDLDRTQKVMIASLAAREIKHIASSYADSDPTFVAQVEQDIAGFFDSFGKALAKTNPDLVADFADASNPLFDGQTLSFREYDTYRNALAQAASGTTDQAIQGDL